jgi:tRNA (guanine37-N1)-methyltransferase
MRFDIITIFPRMFDSVLSAGVLGKALEKDLIEVQVHDLRDFTSDKHRQVDDRPFGGKPGMVLKPEPIFAAVEKVRTSPDASVCLLSPQGQRFNHGIAEELAGFTQVILICGRYEGVDERVNEYLATHEISVGDYVLTGGEPAAFVVVDAVSRLVPDVVGKRESVQQDSFVWGLFDYPQYTRPRDFMGKKVPEVLFSGDHELIAQWRRRKSLEKTAKFRMDLLEKAGEELSSEDLQIIEEIQREKEGKTNEPD